MKLIYSYLQKFLPDLDVPPQKLRDDLTLIGHFTNYYEEIDNEIVFDLDIKVNRGDCLGYYGLARDLAVFYNIPLKELNNSFLQEENNVQQSEVLNIKIDTDNVRRVIAVKLSDLKNQDSPLWLKTFIKCHGTNSVNFIVDLTNYIMFMYGIPCHAFDINKSGQNLIWQMNSHFSEFTSLDGSVLKLNRDILMINSPDKALSLSFWGGESCAIDNNTTSIIIELAIYNPTTVRRNSRFLKATTEASIRLEKLLDPELIPEAFSFLAQSIMENCGGQIDSQVFDYYPQKVQLPQINFDFNKPTEVSGISIPQDFITNCLTKLGCSISGSSIIPPSLRPDISLEADLVEEVVRFYGYNNIPTNEHLAFKDVKDITPPEIYLIEQLKDKMVSEGYDEVLTWPLVSQPLDPKTVITTQNSINSESIYLRQSLIPSLKQQLDQYNRLKLPHPKFFEIGKIFYQENNQFVEKYALGKYDGQNFSEIILDDLPKPDKHIPQTLNNNAIELTSQIITLDANVTIEKGDPLELIRQYSAKIDPKILWSMEITDIYNHRYTFRVCYYNCDDKTAKKIHLQAFNLN